MRRIDTANRATDLFGPGKDGFKNGDLVNGLRPTEFNAEWTNAVQEEIMAPIAAAGFNPDPNNSGQLYAAIKKIFGADTSNPVTFGGIGNGIADDGPAVNSAIANSPVGASILLPEGRWLCTTPLVNPLGKPFVGPGILLEPVTVAAGGYRKINTYSDTMNHVFGMEYRGALFAQLAAGTPAVNLFVHGDSTAAGALLNPPGTPQNQGPTVTMSGWLNPAYLLQNLLPKMARYKGVNQPLVVTNRGVSGTRWIDANALPDLGPTTKVMVFCFGSNNGADPLATRLATLQTQMNNTLGAIRAQTYGKLDKLTLVIVTPNASNNVTVNRDEEWNEQILPVYLAAARKHQCVLIDRYGAMIDSKNAPGFTLDNPFAFNAGQGQGVHGTDARQLWDWGLVMDYLFTDTELVTTKLNGFQNLSSAFGLALSSKPPGDYDAGLTIERCAPGNGWPGDGKVTTERTGDGIVSQTVSTYAAGATATYFRTANTEANTWNPWTNLYGNLTLLLGWGNYSGGSAAAQVKVDAGGVTASIKGLISGGTIAVGSVFASIPAGYRPAQSHVHVVAVANAGNFGTAIVRVDPNGDVVALTTLGVVWTSLSGISYNLP